MSNIQEFACDFLMILLKISNISLHSLIDQSNSFLIDVLWIGTIAFNNFTQCLDSLASRLDIPTLLIKSFFVNAPSASSRLAPIDLLDRINCRPYSLTDILSGSFSISLTVLTENSNTLSYISNFFFHSSLNHLFIIFHLEFI